MTYQRVHYTHISDAEAIVSIGQMAAPAWGSENDQELKAIEARKPWPLQNPKYWLSKICDTCWLPQLGEWIDRSQALTFAHSS